jgi:gluconolactonase
VARDLNDANGVGLSPDEKTLYVSQTVSNCPLKFAIQPDGGLTRRANFALLAALTPNRNASPWLAPDSPTVDDKGNVYVAQWLGGKILKFSLKGESLHRFDISAGRGTTNLAFGSGGNDLYVTVVKDPSDPQARGGIVKIDNVE